MPRLLFEKKGNAIWISHLDLMRLFQRAFKRAGLPLTHTQGFNPRPSVSIALPLSVGIESLCELLEFDLDGEMVGCDEICRRLNAVLVPGVRVRQAYPSGKKIKDLVYLHTHIILEYDEGIPDNLEESLSELFGRESLLVPKKGKNGIQDQDILSMIYSIDFKKLDHNSMLVNAVICAQNPALNPMQIVAGINLYLPDLKPDFANCKRIEVYDSEMNVFR